MAAEKAKQERLARLVDEVEIGEKASETAHALKGERTASGSAFGRNWRHAGNGGWFSYEMKISPQQALNLACTWWGDESGSRTFDILVDGKKIATETLLHNKPGEFFEREYPLAPDLTRDREKVTVRFQAHPGNTAGGVFGLAVVKR